MDKTLIILVLVKGEICSNRECLSFTAVYSTMFQKMAFGKTIAIVCPAWNFWPLFLC